MTLVLNVVGENGLVLRRAALAEDGLSIGRGTCCSLALDDKPHDDVLANVQYSKGEYFIVDEGSELVVVGCVRVGRRRKRVIRPGDAIQIDGVELQLQDTDEATEPAPSDGILLQRARAAAADFACMIRVAEGPSLGRDLVLKGDREYILGRDLGCDLVLEDMMVSRRHLCVWRNGAEALIMDVGSSSGTQLGAKDLSPDEPTAWTRGMMVRLGRSVIALDR